MKQLTAKVEEFEHPTKGTMQKIVIVEMPSFDCETFFTPSHGFAQYFADDLNHWLRRNHGVRALTTALDKMKHGYRKSGKLLVTDDMYHPLILAIKVRKAEKDEV